MGSIGRLLFVLPAVLVLVACAPGAVSSQPSADTSSGPQRTSHLLTISIRTEPPTLAQKVLSSGVGTSFAVTQRVFNATLGLFDGKGVPQAYLAEALPELATDAWRTFPDGRMVTTHRLRPNLTWHDGAPLTADDFVFAWQVYVAPQIGIGNVAPQSLIAEVVAPDPRTVSIRWKRPFPNAAILPIDNLPPLPRHLLGDVFEREPDALATQPFWTA